MGAQNYKNSYKNFLIFVKLWKCAQKILLNPQTFVCYCFTLYKEKHAKRPKSLVTKKVELANK